MYKGDWRKGTTSELSDTFLKHNNDQNNACHTQSDPLLPDHTFHVTLCHHDRLQEGIKVRKPETETQIGGNYISYFTLSYLFDTNWGDICY